MACANGEVLLYLGYEEIGKHVYLYDKGHIPNNYKSILILLEFFFTCLKKT